MAEEKISSTQSAPAPVAPPATPSQPGSGGYGKKGSMWRWVLIYLVIAVVVYGAIILVYKNKKSSDTSGSTTNSLYGN